VKHGAAGVAVMNYVCHRNKQSKARERPMTKAAVEAVWERKPFSLVSRCVEAAKTVVAKKAEYRQTEAATAAGIDQLMEPFRKQQPAAAPGSIFEKKAAGYWQPVLAAQMARSVADSLTGGAEKRREMVSDVAANLDDPAHELELQQVQAQTMLHDLMNDEVISGYPPEQVLDAYNDLARLSPQAALQPMLARGWLRRNLAQGAPEPFEAKEMADVEKTLTNIRNPFQMPEKQPNLLGMA
jgi:hypothetical protein